MKLKTIYICSKCNAESSRWAGQCFKCGAWNTLVEDVINIGKQKGVTVRIPSATVIKSSREKPLQPSERLVTQISEFDRVLGGGFVSDAVVLLVGDPGIGKSTLTLQICDKMAALGKKVLYFSGEESTSQILSRAHRLKLENDIHLVNQNHLESILATIQSESPGFLVVDSVQVMASEMVESQAGSISQIRYVTEELMKLSKQKGIPLLLIGHVTKEGNLAGPQVLTHLVDTVLYLEGDPYHEFRLLRTTKNRFGAVDEVGVFKMEQSGLEEVQNPSACFLEGRAENPIGSVIVPIIEGTRTFLVEVQALTSWTQFGYPRRTASGFDLNRLHIIIAVLNRYADMKLDSCDVFVNVVGGLKLSEPAADLAVALAIASSKMQKPIPKNLVAAGELGLSGEIRKVSQLEKRLKEAQKMGFDQTADSNRFKSVKEAVSQIIS